MFTPLYGGIKIQQVKQKSVRVCKSVPACDRVCCVRYCCYIISVDYMEGKVICVPSVIYCTDADITDVMEPSPDRGLML